MQTGTIQGAIVIGGISIPFTASRSAEGAISQRLTLPAALTGTVTRTDETYGVVTVEAGHGILATDKVDIYWANGVRYGCLVASVTSTTITTTINTGAGNSLPAGTAVPCTITKQTEINIAITGDTLKMLACGSTQRSNLDFQESDGTSRLAISLVGNEAYSWIDGAGLANPLAGDEIAKVMASTGTTVAATLRMGALYDSTP